MLEDVKIAQFRGINTITESSNLGVAMAREAKNFVLRPLGGISVFGAWNSLTCNGTALDFGFVNNVDYLFDEGARLLIQAPNGEWWNATPDFSTNSSPDNTVSYSGATISANLVLTAGQYMMFKDTINNTYTQIGADDKAMNYFYEKHGRVPFYTTRYTSDQAFASGFGPVFTDSNGNKWKLQADNGLGLYAVTIA